MRVLTDLSPLRSSPGFRRLWTGSTLSSIGSAFTAFAVPLQIYDATHSSLAVGGLGLAQLVPLLAVGLIGGHMADTFDRRRVLLGTTAVSTLVSAGLTAQALAGWHAIWLLYGLVAVNAAAGAISAPARRALVPGLLSADQVPAGLALNRVTFQLMLMIGPALGGLVASVPALGLPACYGLDAASFIASFWALAGLRGRDTRPAGRNGQVRPGAKGVAEGLRVVRGSQPLIGALLVDVTATAFALPVVLFPAINAARFDGNPQTLGAFTAAIGAGGLLTAAMSGPFTRARLQGELMLAAVAVWGAAFAGFALVPGLWPTLCLLGLAGAADTVTVVLRGAIVQANAPEHARGRVSAAEYVVSGTGSYLGDLGSGALASLTTAATATLLGGLATVVSTVVISVAIPQFRRYRTAPSVSPAETTDATTLAAPPGEVMG
jgi:MFS family permease